LKGARKSRSHAKKGKSRSLNASPRLSRGGVVSYTSPDGGSLSDEHRLLLRLREVEQLPWKDIEKRMKKELGSNLKVAALQMRYTRLKNRMVFWSQEDVSVRECAL